jgi:outer membrane immunogenic protein
MHRSHFSGFVTALVAGVLLSSTGAFAQCLPSSGANSARGSGFIAGGQGGYNWQQGSWVYGLEADLSGSGLRTSMSGGLTGLGCLGDAASTSAKVDWYGTVRGRLGWTADKVLIYGTGGLAYGDVNLSSSYTAAGTTTSASVSQVKGGFVLGAGLDYMLQPNLVLNFGYQYVDLGTLNLTSSNPPATQTASTHARFHVLTAGLSWRFSPGGGPLSRSWEGGYIGGHGGAAWGLDTNAIYTAAVPSDIRLKRDIVLVGHLDNGIGLYRYRYLWDDTVYVGVMAQEVAWLRPDAVVRGLDDYLRVDYGRLGLRLMTLPEWNARSAGEHL